MNLGKPLTHPQSWDLFVGKIFLVGATSWDLICLYQLGMKY